MKALIYFLYIILLVVVLLLIAPFRIVSMTVNSVFELAYSTILEHAKSILDQIMLLTGYKNNGNNGINQTK